MHLSSIYDLRLFCKLSHMFPFKAKFRSPDCCKMCLIEHLNVLDFPNSLLFRGTALSD